MTVSPEKFSCPLPVMEHDTVQLAHGSGGRLSQELVQKVFLPRLGNKTLGLLEDQAVLSLSPGRLAVSTDSFVVDPLFFPGGDIGDLAVNGTVNDVCMCGAVPQYLTAAFIIEEGLPMETLHRVLISMERAAKKAGVEVVAGDTKVVDRGSCDKLFINTTGIGLLNGRRLSAAGLRAGDKLILSGTVGDHGMTILTSRQDLSLQSRLKSDTAALNGLAARMLAVTDRISAMRDPTRGGLAAVLNEWAEASEVGIVINENALPVKDEVRGACELLGIDPLYVANEGKLVVAVSAREADLLLSAMRGHPLGAEAVIIGEIGNDHPGMVTMRTLMGTSRVVDMPLGEQLPRIC